MKANEAPEKVYLHLTTGNHLLNGEYCERKPAKIRVDDKIIEYTRTDAFIEKVCEWIETNMDDYIYVVYDTVTGMPTNEAHIAKKKVVEDIKNYMKGE